MTSNERMWQYMRDIENAACRKFDLTGMTHDERVITLAMIAELIKATHAASWHSSTGDADYLVYVNDETYDDDSADDFTFVGVSDEFTACCDYDTIHQIRLKNDAGTVIDIDRIDTLTFTRA